MQLSPTAFVANRELIAELEKIATSVQCGEDRILFEQDESPIGIYIVLSGNVTLSMKSALGGDVFRFAAHPSSILGLPAVVGNTPYSLAATAHKGAQVSFVPAATFSQMMLSQPSMAVQVLQVLAAEVRSARQGMMGN